ncbi:oxidoreductase [Terrabacter sp. Ter38]|uniref:WD40/YVTN/BNR-like repeat-containing protein n=1 Tax=Terrabacter sp. Ter38 TaxID=2926030 RepID=UPI0021183849|nr:oxidoreductase [Terrabacter sp. Ter38]
MRLPTRSVLLAAATTALVASATTAYAVSPGAVGRDAPTKAGATAYGWTVTPTGTTERLRGLAPVSRDVAWVSGSNGTVLRTTDGGRTWTDVSPQGLGTAVLQFRDIEAFDARHAVILSIGEGEDSRILVTDDGGATWTESFRNTDPAAFYDCMAFSSPRRGLAMSDPVDGRFRLVETSDGGRSWTPVEAAGMLAAQTGEFAFAASGTCLAAGVGGRTYLVSGGVHPARVFTSADHGHTWTVADSPVAGGASAGIFSVSFRDARRGVIVGGDFAAPTGAVDNAAWTSDGGRTWTKSSTNPSGYRSGSAWVPHTARTVLAVGPSGSDVSTDGGRTWSTFDTGSFDSVECTHDGACWASGEQGRVGVLTR